MEITFEQLCADHPYYCSDSNYYSREAYSEYDSIDEFLDDWKDTDMEYNMVFRFDLKMRDDGTYSFECFFMLQRKGIFRPTITNNVTKADTEKIVSFLLPRFEYIQKMWEPFTNQPNQ